jgi:hypothetical protein
MDSSLFELVGNVEFSDADGIIPAEKFINGQTIDGVKIRNIDRGFMDLFVNAAGKTAGIVSAPPMRALRLTADETNREVFRQLGGKIEMSVDQFWALALPKSANRVSSPGFVARDFTAFMRDPAGVLRQVSAYWPTFGSGGLMVNFHHNMNRLDVMRKGLTFIVP